MNTNRFSTLVALATCACLAIVPPALAVTPEGDFEGLSNSAVGSSGSSAMSLADGTTISCTSGTGSGVSTSKTTGEGSYTLHGCREQVSAFQFFCTSEGQPSGTIKLASTVGHLVYLDENHTKPGVLATPPANGVFAKFACGGLFTVEVKGNGVLGQITSPKCGETSSKGTVVTESTSHGVQKVRQVEETGTFYNLTASLNGGAFQSVATTWLVTGTSEKPVTLTCPEQK
jgi:hypothetical protein